MIQDRESHTGLFIAGDGFRWLCATFNPSVDTSLEQLSSVSCSGFCGIS